MFSTKVRRGVITPDVRTILENAFQQAVTRMAGVELLAVDGEDDHVHLLIAYPPQTSVSVLVNALKGTSSRRIRAADLPEVREKLWGDHFWSRSYCAVSAGGAPLDVIKQYIEKQRT